MTSRVDKRASLRLVARRRFRLAGPAFSTGNVVIGDGVKFGRNVVFDCERVRIGAGTSIGSDVRIECNSFEVGDGVSISDGVRIDSTSFQIGDFGTIYPECFFPGPGSITIGHNFWLGRACIVDSMGTTRVGNNVGIGPQSQLWTHMVFGDVLYGCRFHSTRPLEIGDDVWFVGHCLVSPVRAGDRSLAMLGSVVTKDMEADRSYAGFPAVDVTAKIGPQFAPRGDEERVALLRQKLHWFAQANDQDPESVARIVTSWDSPEATEGSVTTFNVIDRTYTKLGTPRERALIRFLLPDAKFTPRHARPSG